MLSCPSTERLAAYLEEKVAPADAADLTAHLTSCPTCQSSLADLAASDLDARWRALHALPSESTLVRQLRDAADRPTMVLRAQGILRPPPRMDGFEIVAEIGRGGMGVVYRARQLALDRTVALKMMLDGALAGAGERQRFQREAEAVARLQHPNIVQVHEVGERDGVAFLCLEYVAGGNLAQRASGRPQPAREAAAVIAVLADAVQHAHERGVVHRDLKPANVLLTDDGTPKITDFGLARRVDRAGDTSSNTIAGTPSYLSPEQLRVDGQTAGPPTDVYALGAILYELLSGRPPFLAATVLDTLTQVRWQEPVPLSRLVPEVPRDLETICLKCLQKEPRRRYASALALADDVRRFLDGRPIVARPVGRIERAVKWVRRQPVIAALISTIVMVSTLGFALVLVKWLEADERAVSEAEAKQKAVEAGNLATVRAHQEAKARLAETAARKAEAAANVKLQFQLDENARQLESNRLVNYGWRLASAERDIQEHQMSQAAAILEQCPLDLRGWEHALLLKRCQVSLRSFAAHQGSVEDAAYTFDNAQLVTYGSDQQLATWQPSTAKQVMRKAVGPKHQVVFPFSHNFTGYAAGPDGVQVFNLRNAGVMATHAEPAVLLASGSDSERIAFASKDKADIVVWDWVAKKVAHRLPVGKGPVVALTHCPNRHLLAVLESGDVVRIWDLTTGSAWPHVQVNAGRSNALAFSPDGMRLAVGASTGAVTVLTFELVGARLQNITMAGAIGAMAWHPAGRLLAVGDATGGVRLWNVQRAVPEPVESRKVSAPVRCLKFRDDGVQLVVGDTGGQVHLWTFGDPSVARAIRVVPKHAGGLAIAADGRDFVVVSAEGVIAHWNTTAPDAFNPLKARMIVPWQPTTALVWCQSTGLIALGGADGTVSVRTSVQPGELWSLPGHAGKIAGLAFRRDGQRLAVTSTGGALAVWNLKTGKAEFKVDVDRMPHAPVALHPNGKLLATTDAAGAIVLRDAETGTVLQRWPTNFGNLRALAFSPDGAVLACGGDAGIGLWDTAAAKLLQTLTGHIGPITSLSFHPDGKRLASGSLDQTLRLWDVPTGQLVYVFPTYRSAPTHVAFARKGQHLAFMVDEYVHVLDAPWLAKGADKGLNQ